MACLIDSNVIIDLVEPGSVWSDWAAATITDALDSGPLIFNVVIAAEVAFRFASDDRFAKVFRSDIWTFEDIPVGAALRAAQAHREYRARGGTRLQTLPDFLIGAHAAVSGHALITRDPKRYRTYFPLVSLIDPDGHA